MNVRFTKLLVEGFQSIGKESVLDLENQGITIIKGINEYDDKTSSNGSGKSSMVEAINWCLFGKTSAGVTNIVNRYYDKGCNVIVWFTRDNDSYSIQRSLDHSKYKTGVKVLHGDADISCRNKTDTDKLIKETILPFSQDIFLSTIFLSQGFSGRLSSLAPSARKERLEILANIEERVNQFKTEISDKKTELSNENNTLSSKVSYLSGQLDIYTREKDSIESLKEQAVEVPDIPVDELRSQMEDLKARIEEKRKESSEVDSKLVRVSSEQRESKLEANRLTLELREVKKKIKSIQETSTCPTCHQPITSEHAFIEQELRSNSISLQEGIDSAIEKVNVLEGQIGALQEESANLKTTYEGLTKTYSDCQTSISEYETAKSKNATLESKLARLNEWTKNILDTNSQLQELKDQQDYLEVRLGTADHILRLITKEFRTYLLSGIIEYMNGKLVGYSKYLFGNADSEIIKVDSDNTKLNIYLGDVSYESLSGGEKKKVDLALVLVQRDLALNISGFQCNLLVMDEILENMDETSSNASLILLNDVSEEIESMYLISHNNYSLPIDNVITVIKGKDKISNILMS